MKTNKINVLDHGYVRLVDHMGSDLSVVRAARVSYDAAWRAGEDKGSDIKLIKHLWNNHHTTPFESVTFTFEVYAPIFVFRQWHRHRTWSYNELSLRYKEIEAGEEQFYIPDPAYIGEQDTRNKQGRTVIIGEVPEHYKFEVDRLKQICSDAFDVYQNLLTAGWPRELARCCLPVNTYSHMFATVNLLNLMKFLTLRCDSHAQYEILVYANAMLKMARTIAPACIDAWEKTTTWT